MRNGVCKADQIKLIMECRQSGLSDYQWCEQNGIHAGTFYNWVSKLRKSGYTFPESSSRADINMVCGNDTNRITYVKECFFHSFMLFDRVEMSERQTKTERRKNYEKEREKILLIGNTD